MTILAATKKQVVDEISACIHFISKNVTAIKYCSNGNADSWPVIGSLRRLLTMLNEVEELAGFLSKKGN